MLPRYPKLSKSYTEEDDDEGTTIYVPASVWLAVTRSKSTSTTRSKKQETPTAINNRQQLDINSNVYTKVFVRYDKAPSLARDRVHIPEYVYQGDSYPYDGGTYTIYNPTKEFRQGAYYNTKNNRIEYDPAVSENSQLTIWRNWQTNF
jgi:hypothetical protein